MNMKERSRPQPPTPPSREDFSSITSASYRRLRKLYQEWPADIVEAEVPSEGFKYTRFKNGSSVRIDMAANLPESNLFGNFTVRMRTSDKKEFVYSMRNGRLTTVEIRQEIDLPIKLQIANYNINFDSQNRPAYSDIKILLTAQVEDDEKMASAFVNWTRESISQGKVTKPPYKMTVLAGKVNHKPQSSA